MTISSVSFTPTVAGCTTKCTYTPSIVWSLGTNVTRSCKVPPVSTSDNSNPSMTTLPADVFTANSLIVVDLVYPFVPLFGTKYIPPIAIKRSAYLQPRYLPSVTMVNTGGPYGGC
jgi:hypothetical protein